MKSLALAAGAALLAAAGAASAQSFSRSYTYDPYWVAGADQTYEECWNWRARQFERVRPGEYQDDLDRSRCRIVGERVVMDPPRYSHEECWNWRARAYETVRPGEFQDDLDRRRCRIVYSDRLAYRYR